MSHVFSIDSSKEKDRLFAELLSEMDMSQRERFFEFAVWELETHLKYGKDSGIKFYPNSCAIERTFLFNRIDGKFCYEMELLLDQTGDPWFDFSKCYPEIDLLASKLALADFGKKLLGKKFSEEEKISLLKDGWVETDTVFLKQKSLWMELFKRVLHYFEDDVETFFDMADFNFVQLLKKKIVDYQCEKR